MDGALFIAKVVAAWVVFYSERCAVSKGLSADIFGLGEVGSCNLAQMCSMSGAMNECSIASVHLSACP